MPRNINGSSAESTGADDIESWNLVYAAQTGNMAAFDALYARYVDAVYRYVRFRLGQPLNRDRGLVEDVTSETFVRALRRIDEVRYQGRDVGAWLFSIARNLVRDHLKSSRSRREVLTADVGEPHTGPLPAAAARPSSDPERHAVTEARITSVLECLGRLGDDQRECLVLRFLQDLSVAETARVMLRTEGAVKTLQHRAVRRLSELVPPGWV